MIFADPNNPRAVDLEQRLLGALGGEDVDGGGDRAWLQYILAVRLTILIQAPTLSFCRGAVSCRVGAPMGQCVEFRAPLGGYEILSPSNEA